MESNPSHSRPPSVDSVNLGSTYSGYFPSHVNHHLHHQQQQLHQPNIPQYPQQQQYPPQQQHAYQVPYSTLPQVASQQHQSYPHQPVQPAPYATANANTNNGAATYSTNYHYSISASAAAEAAFKSYQQQSYKTQSQQQQLQASPLMTHRQFQPIDPQQPVSSVWQQQQQQQQQWQMPMAIPAMPQQYQQHYQQFVTQNPQAFMNAQSSNDAYQNFVKHYYRDYYQRWQLYLQQQQQAQVRQKTPLKFSRVHARAAFSAHDNRLMVVEPHARIALYDLGEIFTERCYPHLFLQSLLLHVGEGEKGGGSSGTTESLVTLLPFADAQVALDWIRIKLLNDSAMNYELKLILKVITMLYRQNGVVSGLDLSELLFEIISGGAANNSSNNNETADSSTDKMSQAGSESQVATLSQNREQLLAHLRQLLMRGQRRVAITFAQNNGLFDHAIALVYLISFQTGSTNSPVDNGLMISTIRKFISSTLSSTDPLYVFYSHLLQIATNLANSSSSSTNSSSAPIPSTGNAKIESLESFIILLANDIKFDKVEITNNSLRNLIDLMVALLKNYYDYVLPDELFNDRFDCLLVNECLEFGRFRGNSLNGRLLFRKLEFAFELFDFGFVPHALNYCVQIKTKLTEDGLNLKCIQENSPHLRASRFSKFLLPQDSLVGSEEEENRQYVIKLWLYQINKMFSRSDAETQSFDSSLIKIAEPEEEIEEEDLEEDGGDQSNEENHEEEGIEEDNVQIIEETPRKEPEKPQKVTIASKVAKEINSNKVIESNVVNNKAKQNVQINKSEATAKTTTNEDKVQAESLTNHSGYMNNNTNNQSISNEDSFSNDQLHSTLLTNSELKPNQRDSLTSGQLHSPMIGSGGGGKAGNTNLTNHNTVEHVMSPIDHGTSAKFPQSSGNLLQESKIISNVFSDNFNHVNNETEQPPPVPPRQQQQQQQPPSLPPPRIDMFNYGGPRMLNKIDESMLEQSDSFDSSGQASGPNSPVKRIPPFYGQQQNDAFNMTSMQNSLPPTGLDTFDSAGRRDSAGSVNNSNNFNQPPQFFAPPPPVFDSSAPVFDFMSTGQVTSIPSFDSFNLNEDNDNGQQQKIPQQNGNFQQQQQPQPNHQSNKLEPNKDQQKESDSTKSSPKKGGGLFGFFEKFKPKNQAILPDDNNPTIVYDEVKKQWIDKNAADGGAVAGMPPPPPKMPLFNQGGVQSEPNSTLTSPQQSQFPTSPSFPSFEPNNLPSVGLRASPAPNGTLPSSLSSLPSFGAVPPSSTNTNQFRGGGSLRAKSRYIDVFNAQPNKQQQPQQ